MTAPATIFVRNSRLEAAARCLVCGDEIPAGQGVTARYGERILRFRCHDCYARFLADPGPFLADRRSGCCTREPASPASEWSCD